MSADTSIPNPATPQDFNRYSYTGNNPLKYIDPSGHWYYDPGCDCLVQTQANYNEYPWYTDYALDLPPAVPDEYQQYFQDAAEELRARWAYALYWKDPERYTYDAEIWELAFLYYSYSAYAYDLKVPWYTPVGMPPFIVRNIGFIGAMAQPRNPIHFDTNAGLEELSWPARSAGSGEAGIGGGAGPWHDLGYLPPGTARQIQDVVDQVGHPLYVVGGATYKPGFNDIDYAAYVGGPWEAYSTYGPLPGMEHPPFPLDVSWGIQPDFGYILFQPGQPPVFVAPTAR